MGALMALFLIMMFTGCLLVAGIALFSFGEANREITLAERQARRTRRFPHRVN